MAKQDQKQDDRVKALLDVQKKVNADTKKAAELRAKLYPGSIRPKKMVFDQVRHIPGNNPTVTMVNQKSGNVNVEYLKELGFELELVSKDNKLHYRIDKYTKPSAK